MRPWSGIGRLPKDNELFKNAVRAIENLWGEKSEQSMYTNYTLIYCTCCDYLSRALKMEFPPTVPIKAVLSVVPINIRMEGTVPVSYSYEKVTK